LAKPQDPDPVKLFVALLWSQPDARQEAVAELCSHFGEVDYTGVPHPFDMTDYYEQEMGKHLTRTLLAFASLVLPDAISWGKHKCNEIEDHISDTAGRQANLDIGYLDHNKIVLASFKGAGQKIYLRGGVWADLVARYRAGRYHPFEWTFPDFRDGRYDTELLAIRRIYIGQLRALKVGGGRGKI
jgi:hypothetical protein